MGCGRAASSYDRPEILADFSPDERAALRKLLRRVLEGLLKATPDPVKV
jgi:hypothetical protein